MYNLIWW